MQRHYLVHQETLGAMPAPSRLTMVSKSMENIKKVMRNKHDKATELAVQIFEERVKKGIYRYPPGPQPPPKRTVSRLIVTCESKPSEDIVRQIFADESIYAHHKGIVHIDIQLPNDVIEKKKYAYDAFEQWFYAKQEYEDYYRYNDGVKNSVYDTIAFEIAPGEYSCGPKARDIQVPAPMPNVAPPSDALQRIRWERLSPIERNTIQLGMFPNITSLPPKPPGERPTHPDEILGPWKVSIIFDHPDRAAIAVNSTQTLSTIGDARILSIVEANDPVEPYAASCPYYAEAKNKEKAFQLELRNTPNIDEWNDSFKKPYKNKLEEIILYNYNNKIDYMEREARLSGQNLWECPISIDYTCGKAYQIPSWVSEHSEWDAKIPRFPMEFQQY